MTTMNKKRSLSPVLLALLSLACSGNDDATGRQTKKIPEPSAERPACVISADCPSGTHCDLGECVQQCNTEQPCAGSTSCSARARCLSPDQPDNDPEPSATYGGSVQVDPTMVQLSDADESFSISLTSASKEPVRYRVVLVGPHLRVSEPRGEFVGSKKLEVAVSRQGLSGLDVPGTVQIKTSLGDVVVDAPLHIGLTGRYQGTLHYDGAALDLGSARIAIDIIEKNGDVSLRMDPTASLLFPATAAGDTTGFGTYDKTTLDAVISQRIDAAFGASRNHFHRDLGRRIALELTPKGASRIEGTFQETVHGLFAQPVKMTGSVTLELVSGAAAPSFNVSSEPSMPSASAAPPDVAAHFGWLTSCPKTLSEICPFAANAVACAPAFEKHYYEPLLASLAAKITTSLPMEDISKACEAALAASQPSEFQGLAASCAQPAALSCLMLQPITNSKGTTAEDVMFSRVFARTLAPGMVVSQERSVQALYASFSQGVSAERQLYDQALDAMAPTLSFAFHTSVLEKLRSISPSSALGDPQGSDPTKTDFPALRSLARAVYVTSTIDGERARIDAASGMQDVAGVRTEAQERAVLTYLETVALVQLLEAWGTSPPTSVGSTVSGLLNPVDQGFGALVQGAVAFGVPEGFVPFVYRPEDVGKGATNFEQMLAIAATPVAQLDLEQAAFESNKRAYEQNQQLLGAELASVRTNFDLAIKDICGASFDPNAVQSSQDWASCGAGQTGQVGSLSLEMDQARARLQSAESRIFGMGQKIGISRDQLAKTQNVHAGTLNFIEATGKKLEVLTWEEGVINAAQVGINTAAESSLTNLGAPLALAAVNVILELQKTRLKVARQRLETAQTMRFEQASAEIELINGMADIQKQMIDLAQLEVDIQQDVLGIVQAQLHLSNALDRARLLHEERGRALTASGSSTATDPSFRLLRDSLAFSALRARADARRSLYIAGRALEYEVNAPLSGLSSAVLAANNAHNMKKLQTCFTQIHDSYRIAQGSPQQYVSEVSLRKMLGVTGPRQDDVTGEALSEGQQFRQILLQNSNLDGKGGVGIAFGTNLQPGNGLFATDVCADKIAGLRAQLVGDFLGDGSAQVNIRLSGGSVFRSCSNDGLTNWSLGSGDGSGANGFAVVQAGVNDFGDAGQNTSLFGQSVARAQWELIVAGPQDAPSNADLDLTKLEDIVLELTHKALPRKSTALSVDVSCLSAIGG